MNIKELLEIGSWEWPKNAGKMIQSTLADGRAGEPDRMAAAELAGDLVVMNSGMADALLSVLRNPAEPELLRAKAAISFGAVLDLAYTDGFDEPDEIPISEAKYLSIKDTLQKLFLDESNPKQLRRRVLEADVRSPEPWHESAVREAYASGDEEWKLTAVFSMRWVPGFPKDILESLENKNPDLPKRKQVFLAIAVIVA